MEVQPSNPGPFITIHRLIVERKSEVNGVLDFQGPFMDIRPSTPQIASPNKLPSLRKNFPAFCNYIVYFQLMKKT